MAATNKVYANLSATYKQAVLADSPLGYWRMDAASGTTEVDQSGNGHNGTLTNGVVLQQPGAIADGDASEYFNGSGYVNLGNVAALKPLAAFSVVAWIYLNASVFPDNTTNWAFFSWEVFNASGFIFRVDGGTAKLYARTSQAGASTSKLATTALSKNTWYHVCFTFDGTTGRIYLNGVLDASAAFNAPVTNSNNIYISDAASQLFVGRIDDVSVNNVALSAAQVATDYRAGIWTDITADVTDTLIRVSRGFASTDPSDRVAGPTTITFALDNSAKNSAATLGYYAPDSASLRAGWRIGIPVKSTIIANGTTFGIFYGWIDAIEPEAGLYAGMQVVTVTASGWFAQAATAPIDTLSPALGQRPDQLLTTAIAPMTRQPFATSFATGLQTYPYAFDDLSPESSTVLDACDEIVMSGLDRLWEKGDGTLVFETRYTREVYVVPAVTLTDVAGLGALTALKLRRARDKVYNAVKVAGHPKAIDASAVILYAMPISGANQSIGAFETQTFDCAYVDPNQTAQAVGGFNMLISNGAGGSVIGTSGALPTADYQFGSTAGGGGLDLSAAVTVTVVYSATQARITIVNNNPLTAYYGRLRCRGQGIYTYQDMVGRAAISSSDALIGTTQASIDCPYNPDPFFIVSAANYLATLFANDVSHVDEIEVFVGAGDEATMATLLALDISSTVALTETMTGLAAKPYWIDAIELTLDERCNVTFRFSLSVDLAGVVWTLGVAGASELGVTTILGF